MGQLDELAQFGGAGRALAETAREADSGAYWEEDADPSEFFNPDLSGVEFLRHTLAYKIALINNDDGRISNQDFNSALQSLSGGLLNSTEQFRNAIDTAKARAEIQRTSAMQRATNIMQGRLDFGRGQVLDIEQGRFVDASERGQSDGEFPPPGAPSASGVPDGRQLYDEETGEVVAIARNGRWERP